jgi:3-phytase
MHAHRWGKYVFPLLVLAACNDPADTPGNPELAGANPATREGVRFATFNASLNRAAAGQLISDLSSFSTTSPGTTQAKNAAETIQRIRPDVVLINEFDFDPSGTAARLFQENYLSRSINGSEPITYPYRYVAPSNTGVPSGFDLNNNGVIAGGDDAFGFGAFPGQFGMAVYSMYPILESDVRTFQKFLWKDMPGAMLPDDPATAAPADWYSPAELAVFRLSSKSHWDLPIQIDGKIVHFLVSHPTPPVFDGAEDRNGTRNFDEIRFWADYILPSRSRYIYDDNGERGGLTPGALFVIAGDQNSDPLDGDSRPGAIQQLLEHPLINERTAPASEGAVQQTALQGGANTTHRSDPRFDTADFADGAPGNLRADYLLPRVSIRILSSAVFWPRNTDPLFRLVGVFNPSFLGGFPTSDHRLVWADLAVPGVR